MPAGGRGLSGSLGLQLGQGIPTPPQVQDGDLSRAERVARKRGSCKTPRPRRCVTIVLAAPRRIGILHTTAAALGGPLRQTEPRLARKVGGKGSNL
jgi:hypothetical protein